MNLQQFAAWALAQGSVAKYNDGNYKGECVSLINQYCWRVLNVPADAWGHAKDWATNASVASYFDKVGGVPQAGDILVYGSNYGGGFGHIEIAMGNGIALHQNRNYGGKVGQSGVLSGYTAILRKKGGSVNTGSNDMIEDTQRHYDIINREWANSTGRDLTRNEFKISFVGRDKLEALTTIHGSIETVRWQGFANLGRQATNDRWQQQIYDLQAAVKALSSRPSAADLAAVKQQANELKATAQTAVAAKAEAEKTAMEALAKVKSYEAQAAADQAAGTSFLRRLGQLLGLISKDK